MKIFEIRPRFDNPKEKQEVPVSKATYIKTKKVWKLYWMKADFKWHSYKSFPQAKSVEEILETIKVMSTRFLELRPTV